MSLPETSLPRVEPRAEVVTYHANTSALVDGVVSWDNTDLSYSKDSPSNLNQVVQLTLPHFEMVQNHPQSH